MIIELGNHDLHDQLVPIDDQPKITTIHIPEGDDGANHPDAVYKGGRHPVSDEEGDVGTLVQPGPSLGGYTHDIGGISVDDFKQHLMDATIIGDGITKLPGQEILLSVLHPSEGSWSRHGKGAPAWVQVTNHELTPEGRSADVQKFLASYFKCATADEFFNTTDPDELFVKKNLAYWTRTAPGEFPGGRPLPPAKAGYMDDGRVMNNDNDGGGQVGAIGVASAASSSGLTVSGTPGWTSNQMQGFRIVCYSTTSNNMVWGNITANGTGANPSITVDRWYVAATPGGSAGTTPTTPWSFMILDGGMTSSWFVGLATGANAPVHSDHTLATNGNAEITTAGGGLIRKIAPYAQTSGVASRALTLTPVYTANGTDSLPAVVTTIGVFTSMVSGYGGAGGPMKFETALSASATLAAIGDQLTVTETVTGS